MNNAKIIAFLKNNSTPINNSKRLVQHVPTDAIDLMTSREFQHDTRAHVENVAQSLKDNIILNNYHTAIKYNKHLFRDKLVLNVGCGIGILALFAANAGARHVYGVDRSNVTDLAQRIIKANGFEDRITIIKGCIKTIVLPVQQVDIIICDWPGYSVLFQSLADAVVFARDKWLIKNGIILPDKVTLYVGAFEDSGNRRERIDWWLDVYGFNMKCIREKVITEPVFERIAERQVITTTHKLKVFDMNTATLPDLRVHSRFMLHAIDAGHMDGIFTFCDIEFTKSHTHLKFSSSPWAPITNLMQTVLYFDKVLSINNGDIFYGGIEICKTNSNGGDWNHMQVAMQLFSGEPQAMNLEVDMLWHFKQYGANLHNFKSEDDKDPNNVDIDLSQKEEINGNYDHNLVKTVKHVFSKNDFEGFKTDNVQTGSSNVLTTHSSKNTQNCDDGAHGNRRKSKIKKRKP